MEAEGSAGRYREGTAEGGRSGEDVSMTVLRFAAPFRMTMGDASKLSSGTARFVDAASGRGMDLAMDDEEESGIRWC